MCEKPKKLYIRVYHYGSPQPFYLEIGEITVPFDKEIAQTMISFMWHHLCSMENLDRERIGLS